MQAAARLTLNLPPPMRLLTLVVVGAALAAVLPTTAQSPEPGARGEAVPPVLTGPPLEGVAWRLVTARGRNGIRAIEPDIAAWLTFRAGEVRGADGCASLRGSYGRVGDAIAIRLPRSEARSCAGEARWTKRALERGLRAAARVELASATAPTVEAGGDPASDGGEASGLVIRDARGDEVLRFDPDDAADPEIGEWRLVAITDGEGRSEAVAEPPAVLTLRPLERERALRRSSGEVVGSSGCNGFVGTYARAADELRLEGLELSDAPCSPELARQEAAMLTVLRAPDVRLDLPPDRLILRSAARGAALELVTATPLQDTPWLLTSLAGSDRPPADVTLRFEEGVLQGQGPCGGYGGRYETDGRIVRVASLVGSNEPCELERSEQAYLEALRRSVIIDRPGGALRLLDAAGRPLARFDSPGGP